ncbi:MAG: prolipoprotein diacylglyceryl transferase [Burkholderiaceae bacterium]
MADMLISPLKIDPIALQLGPLAIHWYGLTYLAAFGLFVWLASGSSMSLCFNHFASTLDAKGCGRHILFSLGVLGWCWWSIIYCLFYKPAYYFADHPLEVLYVWQGGMSFHGGFLGVMVAMVWYARTRRRPFLKSWTLWRLVCHGSAAGRVGNFINGELWGSCGRSVAALGHVFRGAGDLPRHPRRSTNF